MNIENLSVGMVVKNYTELCKLLNESAKSGTSKTSQLKEWRRYFNYERRGIKYAITDIFDIPIPKSVNSLYTKYIELLLMYELANKEGYVCNYSKTNLFYLLGMVNAYYLKENRKLRNKELSHIPYWQINHFCMRCSKKLSEILFSALNSMKRRCLLEYSIYWVICKNRKTYKASANEVELILKAEKNVLNEMGYDKIPFFQVELFYKKVNKIINMLYGWTSVYNEIEIIYNKEYMPDDIRAVESEMNDLVSKNKLELNDSIIAAINKQAEYYYNVNLEKYKEAYTDLVNEGWITVKTIDIENRIDLVGVYNYPPDYMENQMYLADILISIQ